MRKIVFAAALALLGGCAGMVGHKIDLQYPLLCWGKGKCNVSNKHITASYQITREYGYCHMIGTISINKYFSNSFDTGLKTWISVALADESGVIIDSQAIQSGVIDLTRDIEIDKEWQCDDFRQSAISYNITGSG